MKKNVTKATKKDLDDRSSYKNELGCKNKKQMTFALGLVFIDATNEIFQAWAQEGKILLNDYNFLSDNNAGGNCWCFYMARKKVFP